MASTKIQVCPGSLAEGFETYSPSVLRRMFNGKKVSHILNYESPNTDEGVMKLFLENRKRISISGVQEKLSFVLDGSQLRPSVAGERGQYILKPIPRDLNQVKEVPANEHLTMQIAQQVYGIPTAENVLVFFKSGEPAYLTRRFDTDNKGTAKAKEDFATLAGKSPDTAGADFKYTGSYEEAALLIKKYCAAWRVEVERYFELVVFNYLFSNGDAHLKNFSLLETASGDYLLSPAYDLINTHLHVHDTPFALEKGLFTDDFKSEAFKKTHNRNKEDFRELGRRIGVMDSRMTVMLDKYSHQQPMVEALIERSFLSAKTKRGYLMEYQARRNKFIAE